MLEGGGSRPYGRDDGWVGRLLTLLPAAERDAIAIAPAVPLALRGTVQVGTYAPSRLPQADADLIARLTAMYADDPLLHPLWDSAVKTQELARDRKSVVEGKRVLGRVDFDGGRSHKNKK